MVAAILIPLLFLYFFILTKKENKKYTEQWLAVQYVKKEAILSGIVTSVTGERQRFYYNKYVFVTDIIIKDKVKYSKARHIIPITSTFSPPTIETGSTIHCVGEWEQDVFRFSEYKT